MFVKTCFAVSSVLGVGFLLGAMSNAAPPDKLIRAERIEIVDDKGKVRVAIGVSKDGGAFMAMTTIEGVLNMYVGQDEKQCGTVEIYNSTKPQIVWEIGEDHLLGGFARMRSHDDGVVFQMVAGLEEPSFGFASGVGTLNCVPTERDGLGLRISDSNDEYETRYGPKGARSKRNQVDKKDKP